MSPHFAKEFSIFSFASEDTIVIVLLQKNSDGLEQPISLFSKTLRDSELKYSTMEKQAYALVKALKLFRIYVLHSKIMVYVPNIIVKEMLVKPDSERKRVIWIAKIMEYDVDINPTKLVKGQGLAKLLAELNCQILDIHMVNEQSIHDASTEYDK